LTFMKLPLPNKSTFSAYQAKHKMISITVQR
jgi:hypothetical protein